MCVGKRFMNPASNASFEVAHLLNRLQAVPGGVVGVADGENLPVMIYILDNDVSIPRTEWSHFFKSKSRQ